MDCFPLATTTVAETRSGRISARSTFGTAGWTWRPASSGFVQMLWWSTATWWTDDEESCASRVPWIRPRPAYRYCRHSAAGAQSGSSFRAPSSTTRRWAGRWRWWRAGLELPTPDLVQEFIRERSLIWNVVELLSTLLMAFLQEPDSTEQ